VQVGERGISLDRHVFRVGFLTVRVVIGRYATEEVVDEVSGREWRGRRRVR
jgi:hypothetical protein